VHPQAAESSLKLKGGVFLPSFTGFGRPSLKSKILHDIPARDGEKGSSLTGVRATYCHFPGRACLLLRAVVHFSKMVKTHGVISHPSFERLNTMASWTQVRHLLESQGFTQKDNIWSGVADLGNGRSQAVILIEMDLEGEMLDCLVYNSAFASTSDISAERALSFAKGPFGVAVIGDYYVLRDQVQIADVSEAEIMVPVVMLAHFADQAEKELGGGDKF
jgi:hypothetical protein